MSRCTTASISFLFLLTLSASLKAQTAVLTRSYDNGRTGANISETTFTPHLIETKGLKRFKSLIVDDPRIEAQPLYVPHLQMQDATFHNVLFVATELVPEIWTVR